MANTIKLSAPETRGFWEIEVLYEDEHLLVLNKPSGLPVSTEAAVPQPPALINLLHEAIAQSKPWTRERNLEFVLPAHRLDPELSGILVLARSKPVLAVFANLFGSERALVAYTALVAGSPEQDQFEVAAKLAPHPTRPELFHVNSRTGKRSRTLFKVAERFRGYCRLTCEPLTDRLHQVRAHLRHARFPVLGDRLYGGPPLLLSRLKPAYHLKPGHDERPLLGSPALHAERLEVAHPVTGAPLTVTAPLPKDMQVALKYLRRYASEDQNTAPAEP